MKAELAEAFHTEPIVCKLTDFRESRARKAQTAVVKTTCATNNVGRGTPLYMAPEILIDSRISQARSSDLKRIDIWALGMVIFCVLNPDISFPYKLDLEVAKETNPNSLFNALDHIKGLLEQERKPTGSLKYYQQQKTKWHHLRKVYENCTSFEPSAQPPVNQVVEILNDPEAQYHNVFPLAVHQGSAQKFFLGSLWLGAL